MSTAALKNARMEIKTTDNMKDMLKTAAALLGQDLTSFVLASAEEHAKTVLSDYHSLSLSRDEQADFLQALANPSEPTQALRDLMAEENLVER